MSGKKVIDEKIVEHVAKLSRICLSETQVRQYAHQLGQILVYIHKLNEVDSTEIVPTTHPLSNLRNVFRNDVASKSLTQEVALQNTPYRHNGFFVIPRVLE